MMRKLINASVVALALGGLGVATSVNAASATEPIKVGMILVDSGPFASNYGLADAAKLSVSLLNADGGALGRKFELAVESNPGTPAGAIAAATRAVQQDGAPFLMGMFFSSMSLALGPKLPGLNALAFDTTAASEDLTGKSCQANYFRVAVNDGMIVNAFKAYLKQNNLKSWDLIATDFAGGHDFAKKFTAMVEASGGSVGKTLFNPLGTSDFGSYISQLGSKPSQGLAVMVLGNDAVTFAKQQQQFGLFQKYKTVISNSFTNDIVLDAQGEGVMNVVANVGYLNSLPGDKNAAFVKAFDAQYHAKPNFMQADLYVAFELLRDAINKAHSTDVPAVRATLSGLHANTIYGDVEMRAADHQLVRQTLMAQVIKGADGKPALAIRATYPGAAITPPPSPACKL
ncbi:MAG: ABC transporter substrate-binding protein [Janthinobacterium lividum]